jgi:hypothetical protein
MHWKLIAFPHITTVRTTDCSRMLFILFTEMTVNTRNYCEIEVLMVVTIFCDVTPLSLVEIFRRFEGKFYVLYRTWNSAGLSEVTFHNTETGNNSECSCYCFFRMFCLKISCIYIYICQFICASV